MAKALPIMFQGTHSDAGKSVIATAFCRLFAQAGWKTAPFKAQNMSLNAYVTPDGKEIGRAQGIQAEAAGVPARAEMNPILLKPSRMNESQVVVLGRPYATMPAMAYRSEFFEQGLAIIRQSLDTLMSEYERIVIEGAGSPAEVNLNDRELVNMRIARLANAPVVLIGDIERGGVFASLVGTLTLLEPRDRKRVIGVIINKFHGDRSLLQPGLDWFERYTGVPVLGVVPYLPDLAIDAEDSLALERFAASSGGERAIDIAVIRCPKIANFTDIDPLLAEPDCRVRLVTHAAELGEPDVIVLPGSKNTIEDLVYMKQRGLASRIAALVAEGKTRVVGICGGYQMLGAVIRDPHGVETSLPEVKGLGLLPIETTLERAKVTVRSKAVLTWNGNRLAVQGYEIHMGRSTPLAGYVPLMEDDGGQMGAKRDDGRVLGTYMHDLFHNDAFRAAFFNDIRKEKGLSLSEPVPFRALKEAAFDRLAAHVCQHVAVERIEQMMRQFQHE
ncbi:cobyric acid synthase [Geobacillus sp. C56-T2]|uniref:cobyric acid synthase n=1 Tax=Geobacillus sp. C56-T2 TaxID=600773 RepID=UPI0011A4BD77|nr:cobyric acid synthase [Geobacillus sp. C56-T2]NNV05910.1 cobyric acid synthase [Geobacillus sp. MMMUD3]TWG30612.1 adenosylcobyric acid synthase (glutamine-hydrolysing) [Geobacillus sp. C56-T2]